MRYELDAHPCFDGSIGNDRDRYVDCSIFAKAVGGCEGSKLDLRGMISTEFGDRQMILNLDRIKTMPEIKAALSNIYRQTLTSVYVNSFCQQVLLTRAYREDERDNKQIHKPKVCYPAQGFAILQSALGTLNLKYEKVSMSVKRLAANRGERVEPITCWIVVGAQIALESIRWKMAQLKYGLTGKVTDEILFPFPLLILILSTRLRFRIDLSMLR